MMSAYETMGAPCTVSTTACQNAISMFGNGANFPGNAWAGVGVPAPGLTGYLVVYKDVCTVSMYCETVPNHPTNAGQIAMWATPNKLFRIVAMGDDATQYQPYLPDWFLDPDPVSATGTHKTNLLHFVFDAGTQMWWLEIVL